MVSTRLSEVLYLRPSTWSARGIHDGAQLEVVVSWKFAESLPKSVEISSIDMKFILWTASLAEWMDRRWTAKHDLRIIHGLDSKRRNPNLLATCCVCAKKGRGTQTHKDSQTRFSQTTYFGHSGDRDYYRSASVNCCPFTSRLIQRSSLDTREHELFRFTQRYGGNTEEAREWLGKYLTWTWMLRECVMR